MNCTRISSFIFVTVVFSLIHYFGATIVSSSFDKLIFATYYQELLKPYHAQPDIKKSLENSKLCRQTINGKLNDSYRKQPDFTNDDDVLLLAQQGCSQLMKHYSFPVQNNVTDLELQNPIAFSVLIHTNVNQVLLLLSAVYATQNIYCVHVDSKSPDVIFKAMKVVATCFSNIILATKRENVTYASFARLQADLNCMEDLVSIPETVYNWTYLINLCGQDFPLKTNLEIVKQLVNLQGRNVIHGDYDPMQPDILRRTMFVHEIISKKVKGVGFENKVIQTSTRKSPPPYQIPLRKNLAYNIYSRPFLRWILWESEKAKALLEWSRDTATPDEHYWLMLASLPEAPGGIAHRISTHYIVFDIKNGLRSCKGFWRHYSCVYGAKDISTMARHKSLFANKFDIKYDALPIVCLRKWLDFKRKTFK